MISAPFWDYSGVGPSKGERFLHDVTDSFPNDAPPPIGPDPARVRPIKPECFLELEAGGRT